MYLLIDNKLVEWDGKNFKVSLEKICISEKFFLKSFIVRNIICVYFVLSDYYVYRFNLRKKNFEKISWIGNQMD